MSKYITFFYNLKRENNILYLGFNYRLLFFLLTLQSAQEKKEAKTSCVYKLA